MEFQNTMQYGDNPMELENTMQFDDNQMEFKDIMHFDDNQMEPLSWSDDDDDDSDIDEGMDSFEPIDEAHEDFLARALKSVTFDEQQSAIHDLHGVSSDTQEDPMLVEQKLSQMEEEIHKIKSKSKQAYLQAMAMSPDFGKIWQQPKCVKF